LQVARTATGSIATYSCWLIASLLLLAGATTVVGRVRDRGRTLTLVGGSLVVVGAAASTAIAVLESIPILLAKSLPDDVALKAALTSFDSSAILGIAFALFMVGLVIGLPLLVGGAARGGLLSAWFVVPTVIGMLGQAVINGDSSPLLVAVVAGSFAAPLIALANAMPRSNAVVPVAIDGTLAEASA
jgi:hypothetical protein